MRKLLLIGIGTGNPDHMTVQAVAALNRADVIFLPGKGDEKADLNRLRMEVCARFMDDRPYRTVGFELPQRRPEIDDYSTRVEEWHARIQAQYADLLRRELGEGEVGAFLVWGDPTLYDSTLRIVEALQAAGELPLDCEIIPGISSIQVLAARHRVALNRIGEPVHVTTGRRLAERYPDQPANVVVMLDGQQAFAGLERADLEIFWGAYLGTEDEILVAGPLEDVKHEILQRRAEARGRKGWIMDTYMLRNRKSR